MEGLMRRTIMTVALAGVVAAPAWAQNAAGHYREANEGGRYSAEAQGIPPGYLPPPGQCRVWYDGRPAGHQSGAVNCAAAERIVLRDRAARVVYGGDRVEGGYARGADRRSAAFEQGFKDGRDDGRDDRSDDRRFDPTRHDRYQRADRGDERREGGAKRSPDEYREGFRAGYAEGYRGVMMTRHDR
jgi:hypothetical protein